MTDRHEELFWTELDGELTEAEAHELASMRASEPLPVLEAEIQDLAGQLETLEAVEPPAALKAEILENLPDPAESSDPGVARFPAPPPAPVPTWAKWGAVAAALLLAVVAHQLAFGPSETGSEPPLATPGHPAEFVGTIGAKPESVELATGLDFVRLTAADRTLKAELEPAPGTYVFSFLAPGLEIAGIDFRDGAAGSHTSSEQGITLEVNGPGRVELAISFADPAQPFAFKVLADGSSAFDGVFSLLQEGVDE